MALWGKKKASDILVKYLDENKIHYEIKDNVVSFELELGSYSIFPYFEVDDIKNMLSVVVNVCEKKLTDNLLRKVNEFNLKSKYFAAKVNNNIIYLEYNVKIDTDIVADVFKDLIASLNQLEEIIDNL